MSERVRLREVYSAEYDEVLFLRHRNFLQLVPVTVFDWAVGNHSHRFGCSGLAVERE